ncbi:MAG: AAA family ATPase [Bacteroidales bacterium]|nr:AAA family ATPase [Bacteroidales bacterium]
MNATLNIGYEVENFTVVKYLKTYGLNNAESYRVTDSEGNDAIMKLMIDGCSSLEFSHEVCELISQIRAMPSVREHGVINVGSIDYRFVIRESVEGVKLSELLDMGITYTWEEAVSIVMQVLDALSMLHRKGVFHNDVNPCNVILDDFTATLIGLTHLSPETRGRINFATKDLNPWYMAPETFRRIFNARTDIFSAGALLYRLVFGIEPWRRPDMEVSSVSELREVRRKRVDEICSGNARRQLDCNQKSILEKMLAQDYEDRYSSVEEVMEALSSGHSKENDRYGGKFEESPGDVSNVEKTIGKESSVAVEIELKPGNGFADVAGLENVKTLLADEVMYVLKNPEKAKQYRLKAPNGMLFYGPPGCGKTYVVEKFAQEARLNFVMVKASDLGSIYIHGTQGKIKELFDKAAAKAPTVLCFDELDGMVPDRSKVTSEGAAGEVNEFLSQLNNCSDRGIFVIGTTNRPNMIDPAVLRSGRMDHFIYIPMPDTEARKELFRIHLADRPQTEDIDLEALAGLTEGYVASDIELIVNKTALAAAKKEVPISQEILEESIPMIRKSVSESDREAYEAVQQQMKSKSQKTECRRIGFVTGQCK